MRRQSRFLRAPFCIGLVLTLATALTGCGGGYGCGSGFAINNTALKLTTVTDSRTGTAISHIILSNIRFNGTVVTDLEALVPFQLAQGVTVVGNTLECDVPCSFGDLSGTYQFTASATGYQSADKEFKGAPIFNNAPCPSYTTGSTEIKFILTPQ